MYEQLIANKSLMVLVICMFAACICFIAVKIMQTIGMEKVRKTVYSAFVDAENRYKQGDNKTKFEYVVNIAKKAIPAPFNLFITETLLREVVQLWFDLCKDLLDDGKMNGTGNTNKEKGQ